MLRRRLLRRVLASAARGPQVAEDLGLDDDRLRALAADHRFGSLASSFPRVGGPLELRVVAWWGSALADIGCAASSRGRDEALLADAARFHLAVALFDEVVDRIPDRASALAASLEPSRLRLKLERPTCETTRLAGASRDLDLIVALFDKALEGIGRRVQGDAVRRAELAEMLEAMYRSELSLSADPFAAKTLPFVFIGHLALAPEEAGARRFFVRLAELLCLWDDWQDLAADGWAGAPNAHLGPGPSSFRLRGLARGLWLGLMGALPRHPVPLRLTNVVDAALGAAQALELAARGKTLALLAHMLGGHPGACPVIGRSRDARARIAIPERAAGSARPHAPGSA